MHGLLPKKNSKNDVSKKISMLDVSTLLPSSVQPRTQFDDAKLLELAKSIMTVGVLQPLIVRKTQSNKFEIVAGERRFRAAKIAKIKKLPCIVMNLITEKALAVALVENIQREDLNPIEEALAYQRLKENLKFNQEEIASQVGKDRATIANTMRLLRLPKLVQEFVASEQISMGHARAILALENTDMMAMVAKKIIREGLSVRRVEGLIRAIKSGHKTGDVKKLFHDNDERQNSLHKEIQQKLEYALGTKVVLKKDNIGYAIMIYFADAEQLNGLLDTLGVEV